jgi:hypothetical protein
MRSLSISRFVALSSALMLLACKDTTASGPPSVGSQSNITGGTGQFAGATGSIRLVGVVHNLIGAGSGSGKTYFDLHYTGSVCT